METIYISDVKAAVAARCGLTVAELDGRSQARRYVRPRWIAFLLCRDLCHASLMTIGLRFDRDHTTVIHGLRKIRKLVEYHRPYADMVADIKGALAAEPEPRRDRLKRAAQAFAAQAQGDAP